MAAAPSPGRPGSHDPVLEALELILPFAVAAPAWAIEAAQSAIKAAKGERS